MSGDSPSSGPTIFLAPYDPVWAVRYQQLARTIRAALGDRVRLLEHVGSTSVPGLRAKPIIDIVLAVTDSAAEAAYLPHLQRVGYRLILREPAWYQHRLMHPPRHAANLHIFSEGCQEIARTLQFRDWLRGHEEDRLHYESVKQQLAARSWPSVQAYADAKSEVIQEILTRAGREIPI